MATDPPTNTETESSDGGRGVVVNNDVESTFKAARNTMVGSIIEEDNNQLQPESPPRSPTENETSSEVEYNNTISNKIIADRTIPTATTEAKYPPAFKKENLAELGHLIDELDNVFNRDLTSGETDGCQDYQVGEDNEQPHGEVLVALEEDVEGSDAVSFNGFWQVQSKRVARSPWFHFCSVFIVSVIASVCALVFGGFTITATMEGWNSRGTLIANRQTQSMLIKNYADYLFYDGERAWIDLLTNVQPGWEYGIEKKGVRRLSSQTGPAAPKFLLSENGEWQEGWSSDYPTSRTDRIDFTDERETIETGSRHRRRPFELSVEMTRRLQEQQQLGAVSLSGCDLGFYEPENLLDGARLSPVWRVEKKGVSALSPEVIHDICIAETNTQDYLTRNGLCITCDGALPGENHCFPPVGIVFFARLRVGNGFDMTCDELAVAWEPYQAQVEEELKTCVRHLKERRAEPGSDHIFPESCPFGFSPTMVDLDFDETLIVTYTSSIFATSGNDVEELFDHVNSFDQGETSSLVSGMYDTQYENFALLQVNVEMVSDLAIACLGVITATFVIVVHTKSVFLSFIGIVQVTLAFPLSFFTYKLLLGLEFFPFMNFIGLFVLGALGADDVFVATDKWKNARLAHPSASTEYIAALALPDAGGAMFLTSITTAIAFFATAICPVPTIRMFALFVGLLVILNYVMNVLLYFPVLCIYDRAIQNCAIQKKKPHCCLAWASCCGKKQKSGEDGENDDKPSFIHRILLSFYNFLHENRWISLVVCVTAIIFSTIRASKLGLPPSSDVRLLPEESEFERYHSWRKNLLSDKVVFRGGDKATIIWGAAPADTGVHGNPASWSQLVLDPTFQISDLQSQVYLADFCDNLFAQKFASPVQSNFVCPMQAFDLWLQDQYSLSQSSFAHPDVIYANHCNNADGLPVPQANFDECIIAWSRQVEDTRILSRGGTVKIIYFHFAAQVRFDESYESLDNEWKLIEGWMQDQNRNAPSPGVRNGFFSSFGFWWYDTTGQMFITAYSSAGIALAAAAAVVLFSTRSIVVTIFSTLTIGYVLASVTATLVNLGWSLGFMESICFAILIGISVDFVVHFGHAYTSFPGEVSKGRRTKYALVHMGPSIMAAAITTLAAAFIMLFTTITFFYKFALIVFFTIIQACVGSFIVFLTMTDCLGPSNPTSMVDRCVEKFLSIVS